MEGSVLQPAERGHRTVGVQVYTDALQWTGDLESSQKPGQSAWFYRDPDAQRAGTPTGHMLSQGRVACGCPCSHTLPWHRPGEPLLAGGGVPRDRLFRPSLAVYVRDFLGRQGGSRWLSWATASEALDLRAPWLLQAETSPRV